MNIRELLAAPSMEHAAIIYAADTCRTSSPRDRAMQALILRGAHDRDFARRKIMQARAERLAWVTRTQRDWQARISRRPARGRHHDSWALRESYVRGGNWTDYLDVAAALGAPPRCPTPRERRLAATASD